MAGGSWGALLERDLAPAVVRHLQGQGYRTFEEVYFNGRIADIIALRGDEVVAIELKLRDYREAHRQAMAYQVGCHKAYAALPLKGALLALRKHEHAFATSGAGLLAIETDSGEVRELIPARHHESRFLPFMADALLGLR